MNSKYLMIASALFLGLLGISLIFLPQDAATWFVGEGSHSLPFQIMGSLYFGFAIINWMAKGAIIGGIYNKPIALGNFIHFMIVALTLLKIPFQQISSIPALMIITILYITFAGLFGWVAFTHPIKEKK